MNKKEFDKKLGNKKETQSLEKELLDNQFDYIESLVDIKDIENNENDDLVISTSY